MKTKLFALLLIMGMFVISCSKYDDLGEELVAPAQDEVLDLKASGNVRYTVVKVSNPNADQLDAYQKIDAAMSTAIWYFNTYTNRNKHIYVHYKPSVPTAQGGGNTIKFGKKRVYMNSGTAMHELNHCFGVGTTQKWRNKIKNGKYTGYHGKQALKNIDPNKVLKGDKWHFWPYGLNYPSENTAFKRQCNAKINEGFRKDGIK